MNDNADSKKILTIHLCGSFTKDSLVRQLAIRINTVFVCTTKTPTVQFEQDDCYVTIFYLDLNKIEEAAKTTSNSTFITKQPGTNVLVLASENEREELGEGFLSLNAEATVKEIGLARKLHLTKEDTNTQNSCNVLSPVDVRRKLISIIRSVIPVQNEFVAASYTEDRYPDWLNLASFEDFKGTKIVVCSVDNERDHMALVWKPLIHLLNEQNSKHFAARTLILNKDHLSGASVFTADMVILCWNGSNRNVLDNYKKFLDALGKSMKTKPELKQSIIIHISGRPSSSKMEFDPETVSQLNIEGLLNPIAWHPVELSTITTDNEWLPDGPQHNFLTNILGEFPNKYDPFGGNYSAYVKQNNSINWKFSDTPDKQGAPCTIIVQPDKQRSEWKVKLEGAFPKMTSIAQMEPLQGSNNKWKITCTVRKPRTEKFPILDRVDKQVFFAEIEPRPETIFVLKFLQQRTKKGVVTAEKLVLSENVRPTETFNSIPPSSETPAPQEDPFV